MEDYYISGRTLLKKNSEGEFQLHNLDTHSEAIINSDLVAVIDKILEYKNPEIASWKIAEEKGLQKDVIGYEVDKAVTFLADNGFISTEKNGASLNVINRPNLQHQVDLVYLEVTKNCNLKCPHCYNDSSPVCVEKETYVGEYIGFIDEINRKIGPTQFVITGGEPFYSQSIFPVIGHIYNSNVDFSVFTNATLLNQDRIHLLKKYNPKFVAVSLDGMDKETTKIVRGSDCFDKVSKNIKGLTSEGIDVRINSILLKGRTDNKRYISDFLKFARDLGAHSVIFSGITMAGRGRAMSQFVLDNRVAGIIRDCYAEFNGEVLDKTKYKTVYDRALNFTYCGIGDSIFMLTSTGYIVPCPMLNSGEHFAGKMQNGDIVDIWENSEVFKKIRGNRFDSSGKCKNCDVGAICQGGCRASVYERTGGFVGPDEWLCGFYDKS